ncbi:biotrophy-associated secreted protein 2 [Ophiocordyceps camponoti-floridani]|uniref:Biotrophy-associated secreted protein 2 n=1 Tax=Ophiocordyceps camponoti-floridani TaxID=2030778 RepID=A0A8H4Q1Y7_9HYPO|nr:biotrophy-associated secreted protein 2 [Ophiocordyceps camponoti-floridani]
MVRLIIISALALVASVNALKPDPAGAKNKGNGQGGQFIGGECLSTADCASTCCCAVEGEDFMLCSGIGAQFQSGKLGCASGSQKGANGNGNGGGNGVQGLGNGGNSSGQGSQVSAPQPGQQGAQSNDPSLARVGKGAGDQFITGPCASNADCSTGCCASNEKDPNKATCSAVLVSKDGGKLGCGTGPGDKGLNGGNDV